MLLLYVNSAGGDENTMISGMGSPYLFRIKDATRGARGVFGGEMLRSEETEEGNQRRYGTLRTERKSEDPAAAARCLATLCIQNTLLPASQKRRRSRRDSEKE